uniref:Outer membrane usher protein FasD n=1 Tax=Enterobacter asburiae TaxID=61645 RepID=A0A455W3Y5_ENTAS|nr:fimbria/pilus outer membrane usher protein [Enterobacter asburiae]BBI97869.1 outer membrane usher protein FasD [Enterobacter asburiae]BBI97896.1 outer membrane usher protein FasD [Enterobacter asburiae]
MLFSSSFMSRLLAGSLLFICSTSITEATEHTSAVRRPEPDISGEAHYTVYLDVIINGVSRGFHPFDIQGKRIFANSEVLSEIGLTRTFYNNDTVELSANQSVSIEFNPHLQSIKLETADSNTTLDRRHYGIEDQFIPADSTNGGAVLNYQLLHNTDKRNFSSGIFSELRGMSSMATFSTSMVNAFDYGDERKITTKRLDTRFDSLWQDTNFTLQAGDAVTDILSWTRPYRFAGIKISNTTPLSPGSTKVAPLEFEFTPKAPSEIDLLLDGSNSFRQRIPGGPFTLLTIPQTKGFSNAELWITDRQTGGKTLITKPVYFSANQLKAGASEWSIDTGFYRSHYGVKSNAYDDKLLINANSRYGLNRNISLENHAEIAQSFRHAGAGMVVTPHPYLGELTWNHSFSNYNGYTGDRSAATHQWNNRFFYSKFSWETFSKAFKDIPSLYGNDIAKRNITASMGIGTDKFGFFSLSNTDTLTHTDSQYRTLSLSWQKGFADFLSLYITHRITTGNWNDASYFAGVSIPLGNTYVAYNSRYNDGAVFHSLSLSDSSRGESGFSWKGRMSSAPAYKFADGDIEYQGTYATFSGNVSTEGYISLGMAGSLAYLNNNFYAGRPIQDAFASVSTSGIGDVPVYVDNRFAGITNSSGYLFLPQLSSFQQNKISIDTLSLPADYEFSNIEKVIVPAYKSGNIIKFDIKPVRAAILVLTNHHGEYLPAGTVLKINSGNEEFIVGFEGQVYITGLNNENSFIAHLSDAGRGIPGLCSGQFSHHSDSRDAVPTYSVTCQ